MDIDNINLASLQIGGIDTKDHPDYCDAYYESGEYMDGKSLSDDELEKFKEIDSDFFYELLNNTIY